MAVSIYVAINALMILAAVGCVVMWGRQFAGWRKESTPFLDSLVPVNRRQKPFWTVADAMILFGIHIVLLVLGRQLLLNLGILDDQIADPPAAPSDEMQLGVAGLSAAAAILSSLAVLVWLRLIDSSPVEKLSLRFRAADAYLGLQASVMLLPPVLLINWLVTMLEPYSHEVLKLLQSVDSISVFAVMFFATAVATPFFEEFLFRVLIQGGLQGMIDSADQDLNHWRPRSYLPILISSVIFALMHFGQGAAPIPLFFLSLGLGYLYRQTGNITAPMVVHMVLNSLTLIAGFTGPVDP